MSLNESFKRRVITHCKFSKFKFKEDEVDTYLLHLQDILSYANIVSKAPTEGLSEAVGVENKYNVFRKDEVKNFEDKEALMANAPEKERNMFKIPKVIQ